MRSTAIAFDHRDGAGLQGERHLVKMTTDGRRAPGKLLRLFVQRRK
jgi:hypothetical protein